MNRLLNDMGADPDQLPLMQHALMRTWRQATGRTRAPGADGRLAERQPAAETTSPAQAFILTVKGYESVGGIAKALSNHAEKAFEELSGPERRIAEIMFRRLTNEGTGLRDTRRLASVDEVARVAGVTPTEVDRVVEAFRRPGREFLTVSMLTSGAMPANQSASGDAAASQMPPETILDISHESLIRHWGRLTGWVEEEAKAADNYRRLLYTAQMCKAGKAALWGSPDLDVALEWTTRERPNPAWAERYGGDFELTMRFLEASEAKRQEVLATSQREAQSRRQREEDERRRELAQALAFAEAESQAAQAERRRADVEQQAAAKLRRRAWILGWVVAVCCALAVLSYELYREASHNTDQARANLQAAISHKLASRANEYANEQRDLALLLSVQAHHEQNTVEARNSLLKIVASNLRIGRFLHSKGYVTGIAFSQDGRRLASVSLDGRIGSWDVASGTSSESPVGGTGDAATVTSVALSADGGMLAIGLASGTLRVVDITRQRQDVTLSGLAGPVRSVALSPDGSRVAGGTDDGSIWVWRTDDGTLLGQPPGGSDGAVRSVAFSRDNQVIAWGSQAGPIHVSTLGPHSFPPLEGHTQSVLSLVFDPSAKRLASGGADGSVRVWNMQTRRSVSLSGHNAPVASVAFSIDGTRLASGSDDGTARVWNLDHTGVSLVLTGHAGRVLSVAFAPDGTLASGGSDSIILWRTADNPSLGLRTSIEEGAIQGRNGARARMAKPWPWPVKRPFASGTSRRGSPSDSRAPRTRY